jgi:hypothetical protein
LPERWNPLAQLSYFLRNFLRRFHTVCSDSLAARMFDQNLAHTAGDPCFCALPKNMLKVTHKCQPSNRGTERSLRWYLPPWQ